MLFIRLPARLRHFLFFFLPNIPEITSIADPDSTGLVQKNQEEKKMKDLWRDLTKVISIGTSPYEPATDLKSSLEVWRHLMELGHPSLKSKNILIEFFAPSKSTYFQFSKICIEFFDPLKKYTFPIFAGSGFGKAGSESGQRKNPESGSRNTGNKNLNNLCTIY